MQFGKTSAKRCSTTAASTGRVATKRMVAGRTGQGEIIECIDDRFERPRHVGEFSEGLAHNFV
jgi:hypothetical protein